MNNADQTLIESTSVRRARLASALVHGPLDRRRKVNQNVRRLVASVVVAAVAGVGCVGWSLVASLLADRKHQQVLATLETALASNPVIPPGTERDEATGLLVDETGALFDPRTGYPVDPTTGLATDPQGRLVDPRSGWYADPETGHLTDPRTRTVVDPTTMTVVTGP
ncbi:MAG: hypothetical protein FWD18_09230 [Micrococcales bacterium]|nr:hypothetical protein [Micrococcales bacterium]